MESADIQLPVQNNNPPPPIVKGYNTQSNININNQNLKFTDEQNQGIQIAIHNNKYVMNPNLNNDDIYQINPPYVENKVNKPSERKDDLEVSNSSFHMNFFIDYDLSSKFLMKVYGIVFFEFLIHMNFFIDYDLSSKFLMKVYGIVFFEFLIIFGLVMIFQIQSIKDYFHEHSGLFFALLGISIFVVFIFLVIFLCSNELLRKVPANYIALFFVTIFLGIFCALIASLYNFIIVLGTITCVISISIGAFCVGLLNKGYGAKFWYFIISSLIALIVHYAILALILRSDYLYLLYCTIYALLYSFYIAFDTIVIKEGLSLDDYIYGAFILTIDIIRLFIFLLQIFGQSSRRK